MILAMYDFGAFALVLGWITQYFFAGFSIFLFSKSSISWIGIFQFQYIKSELIQSLDFWSERVVSNLVGSIDVLLFGKLLGADFLGIYEVFKRIVLRLINIISISVEKVIFPLMCQVQSCPNKLGQYYWQGLSVALFLALPISIGGYFFPENILYIFGDEWQGQEQSFQFLAIFSLFHVLLNPVDVLYAAIDKISTWRNLNIIFLGIFFIYLFIPDDYILSTFLLIWFLFTAYTYLFALRQILQFSFSTIWQYILSPLLISISAAALVKQLFPSTENFVFLNPFLFGILYIGLMLLFHSSIMSIVRSLIITGKQDKAAK
jgi:O-antigen/teichoic acid export membrane protein